MPLARPALLWILSLFLASAGPAAAGSDAGPGPAPGAARSDSTPCTGVTTVTPVIRAIRMDDGSTGARGLVAHVAFDYPEVPGQLRCANVKLQFRWQAGSRSGEFFTTCWKANQSSTSCKTVGPGMTTIRLAGDRTDGVVNCFAVRASWPNQFYQYSQISQYSPTVCAPFQARHVDHRSFPDPPGLRDRPVREVEPKSRDAGRGPGVVRPASRGKLYEDCEGVTTVTPVIRAIRMDDGSGRGRAFVAHVEFDYPQERAGPRCASVGYEFTWEAGGRSGRIGNTCYPRQGSYNCANAGPGKVTISLVESSGRGVGDLTDGVLHCWKVRARPNWHAIFSEFSPPVCVPFRARHVDHRSFPKAPPQRAHDVDPPAGRFQIRGEAGTTTKPASEIAPEGKPGHIWVDDHWERKRAK